MSATALVWAWANYGQRWHLRASGDDLALCGVGKRGWELTGDAFDRNADDIYVAACLPCLRVERMRTQAPAATRLTPAQRRGLELLATPGAVAYTSEGFRWRVTANQDGMVLGTIHSESLMALRLDGYVEMFNGGNGPLDFRQRITEAGRAYVTPAAPAGGPGR